MTEDQLQAALWQWAWNAYPQYRKHMWAVTNSGLTNPNRAKAMGLLSGVWDLHVFYRNTFHIIETKVGNNQLTTDRIIKGKKVYGQKEWGELMADHGATRHIYRSLEEGKQVYESIFGITGSLFGNLHPPV